MHVKLCTLSELALSLRAFFVYGMRTLEWDPGSLELRMIDQRAIPGRLEVAAYSDYTGVAGAIRDMVVRGAPAIGVAAAYGIALAGLNSQAPDKKSLLEDLENAAVALRAARPTAVNLGWAVERMMAYARAFKGNPIELRQALIDEAGIMADEDVAVNLRMAKHGASLIHDGDTIIHHCNTGALAAVDWGTALGAIRVAHDEGKRVHVLVDETRPRLQGTRLTAWELLQYGIPFDIITDNAAGYFLSSGQVQKVMFGADRVAANGDVANKIGSYMLALAAKDNNVPVYSVFPCTTVDLTARSGADIAIEERSPDEVLNLQINGINITPAGAHARNPAFDITPNRLITAYVTDAGIITHPFHEQFLTANGREDQFSERSL